MSDGKPSLSALYSTPKEGRRRVLVVGIDGVRWDSLADVATPSLDRVAQAGFRMPVHVNSAGPTISGPCWSTIATGTLPPEHGVIDNDEPSHAMPDDFLTIARRAGLSTYAAVAWPELVEAAGCGPIFSPGGRVLMPENPGNDQALWDEADGVVASGAARALAGDDIDAAFVYLGLADEVAHTVGVGPEYFAAIETCDRRLGLLLNAVGVSAAGVAASGIGGSWAVIVATDHGHVDQGGHGGDSAAERTAWVAACGPGIGHVTPAHLEQADIFAQVLKTLGLAADPARFARSFGARDDVARGQPSLVY
ncbi:MAG: alkaline phosphatase family protein [Nakamurella sp.]